MLPLVYAGNVARGIIAALQRPEAAGRAYNLAQDNQVALRDVIARWRQARGDPPPRIVPIPGALIESVARGIDALSAALPVLGLPGARRPARLLREDNPYDSSRARAELDWTSLVPLEEAVERTVKWLRTRANAQR